MTDKIKTEHDAKSGSRLAPSGLLCRFLMWMYRREIIKALERLDTVDSGADWFDKETRRNLEVARANLCTARERMRHNDELCGSAREQQKL